ncbi:MAG: NAD(P)/FAD-dependent oxidoreductase [Gaiellales bacterium]|nr:MAG: NAD(P)/FAD-dependent oxidoreductase [Gaiellales bacterium]
MGRPFSNRFPGAVAGGGRLECDVLVVGAGPAGSAAARSAAAAGARVIVAERRRTIGYPARCAGFVPRPFMSHPGIPGAAVIQPVERMITHHPLGVEESRSVGYIVERELFDQELATSAAAAGAGIMSGCRASIREDGSAILDVEGAPVAVHAQVVIGADGPLSAVGRRIGSFNRSFALGAQWLVSLVRPLADIHVFFDRSLPGGYGWLFPRDDRANLGVAVAQGAGVRPLAALRKLAGDLSARGLIRQQAGPSTGGLIPVGGPLACRAGSFLLAGDAAGHCHPLTGAGIATAFQGGELAGESAAAAATSGDSDLLRQYEEEMEEMFAGPLRRAAKRRAHLYTQARRSDREFSLALRQNWIAFPEYAGA